MGAFFRRNPSFLLLWVGQLLSQSGARMYQMAVLWWILSRGGDASGKLVGLFLVMTALPALLLVKIIGRKVDGSRAKPILVTCDAAASVLVTCLAFGLGREGLPIGVVYLVGFLGAALQAFIDPTLNKSVGEVLPPEDVEQGVAVLASTQSLANFAGAVMGAMLIAKLGVAGTVGLAAGGYLVSAFSSSRVRFRFAVARAEGAAADAPGWSLLADYPLVKKVLVGFGWVNFFGTPTLVVLPLFVKKTLGGSASLLGTLEAFLWVGLLSGTFLSPKVTWPKSRLLLGAMCLAVLGTAIAVPGFFPRAEVLGGALLVLGVALGINNVKFVAFFQETIPAELKGRFFALMSAVISFTFPIAYFLFGALADMVGPDIVVRIQGAGVVSLAVYFYVLAQGEAHGTRVPSRAGV